MSKTDAEIGNALKAFGSTPDVVMYGTVKTVSGNLCDVDVNGVVYHDVLLQSIKQTDKGFLIVPKANTTVLVGRIGKSNELLIIHTSEVDKMLLVTGNSRMEIDADGFILKRNTETLKKLIDDLITQIKLITVTTAVGPSGTPVNAAAFAAIATRLNSLFKE